MDCPCDTCRERQLALDPRECRRGFEITGIFRRLYKTIFGCHYYREWKEEEY